VSPQRTARAGRRRESEHFGPIVMPPRVRRGAASSTGSNCGTREEGAQHHAHLERTERGTDASTRAATERRKHERPVFSFEKALRLPRVGSDHTPSSGWRSVVESATHARLERLSAEREGLHHFARHDGHHRVKAQGLTRRLQGTEAPRAQQRAVVPRAERVPPRARASKRDRPGNTGPPTRARSSSCRVPRR
jgi:hypothetical protein